MTIDRLEDKSIHKMTLFYRISLQASKKWLFLSIIYSSNELICLMLYYADFSIKNRILLIFLPHLTFGKGRIEMKAIVYLVK